jgi:signal transduction histidine kinase/CheY-like chemotaxis protein
LQRQLRRHLDGTEVEPRLEAFVRAVDDAYRQADKDRRMLERSLEISSDELHEANRALEKRVRARTGELEKAVEDTRIAHRAKAEFLAHMSHELRTPLHGVLGLIELLLKTEVTEKQARLLRTAQRSGRGLLSVINGILDFSKIEARALQIQRVDFDLNEVIEDAAGFLKEHSRDGGLAFRQEIDPRIPPVLIGDPHRLRQVLSNLLGNASKFTQNGSITLRCRAEEFDAEDVIVLFEVEDTGIGIPSGKTSGIFSPFAQADATTTREFGGTGLGLSISRQLVEAMGGEISVRSELGEGSTFAFTIRAGIAASEAAREDGSPARILVAGSRSDCIHVVRLVRGWGIPLSEVASPAEAVACLGVNDGRKFDAVIVATGADGGSATALGRLRDVAETRGAGLLVVGRPRGPDGRGTPGVRYLAPEPRPSELFDCLQELRQSRHRIAGTSRGLKAPSVPKGQVLLVEDSVVNQEVAQEMLESLGVSVDVVADGLAAVEAVVEKRYDLIFMDVQMPRLDGLRATRRIRVLQATRESSDRVPIVALTANVTEAHREEGLNAGMDDFLTKPFTEEMLRAALIAWLPPNTARDPGATVPSTAD